MSLSRFQEDLLQNFHAQRKIVSHQIGLLEPMAASLRKPAAQRLANKTGLVLVETVCYLLFLASLGFTVLMNLVYPFTSLMKIRYIKNVDDFAALRESEHFSIAVHCMAVVIAVLFFIIARMTRRIRLKNNVLHLAGKNIKSGVGELLQARAALEVLTQRHFNELPVLPLTEETEVNAVANPGYDYSE